MYFSKQDAEYVENLIKHGTSLEQAIAQMEVMRDEANFKRDLALALSDYDIQKKIREFVD